jgi:plasmid stabilization system protein ParE
VTDDRVRYRENEDGCLAAIYEEEERSPTRVSERLGVSTPTIVRWLRKHHLSGSYGLRDSRKASRDAEPIELLSARRQVERANAEVRSLRAQLKHAAKHANIVEDVREMLAPVIADCVLPRPSKPTVRRSRSRKPLKFVWHLCDLHWGEIVESRIVNDVNAYSPGIAARRLQHTVDTILRLADNYDTRHGVDELVLAVNGDTIGGDLHPDSAEYAARSGRQMLDASLILAQIGHEAASHFERVRFLGTVGNHPRTTRRMPTGSARVDTSWELAMHEQVRSLLVNAPNVSYEVTPGYTLVTTIGPDKWAFSHGDAVKGGGGQLGIPAYGLKRQHDAAREWSMVLAQMTDAAASGIVKHSRYGHFHVWFAWQAGAADIMLAPSPKGVDPFVKDILGKYSPPQFVVEVVHPDHGVIAVHPIDLSHIVDEAGACRYVWNPEGMVADVFQDWAV